MANKISNFEDSLKLGNCLGRSGILKIGMEMIWTDSDDAEGFEPIYSIKPTLLVDAVLPVSEEVSSFPKDL